MSITLWELPESGSFTIGEDTTSFVNRYTLTGTSNRLEVLAEVLSDTTTVPEEIQGIPRTDINATPIPGNENAWDIEVLYSTTPGDTIRPQFVGDERTAFTTGGGSARIKQALEHVESYAPPGREAPDHGGAINVTKTGVEGVDIVVPQFSFTVEKVFDPAAIDSVFLRSLFETTGAVNDDTFRGFEPGELLLSRVDGSPESDEAYRISYEFLGSENAQDLAIGEMTGIVKEGHDYLWTEQETTIDGEGTPDARAVTRTIAAHVERVYPRKTFGSSTGLSP